MNSAKRLLGIGLIFISALFLSGCGFIPLPEEQRYQKIDALWDELEISSLGEILSDTRGGGGGITGSVTRDAEIQGVDSFSLFKRENFRY